MSEQYYKISGARMSEIADAIREVSGESEPMTAAQMPAKIRGVSAITIEDVKAMIDERVSPFKLHLNDDGSLTLEYLESEEEE